MQSQITISFKLITFIVMMIKKYVGVFLNLRVAVIYKKYRPKKENSYKALKRLKYVKQGKMRQKDTL